MRTLSIVAGLAASVGLLSFVAPPAAGAGAESSCSALTAQRWGRVAAERVAGVDATACRLVGKPVVSGDIGVNIPEPGAAVTAQASGDGVTRYLHVEVAKSGLVRVSTSEPAVRYTELLKGGTARDLAAAQATTGVALAYSRCSDWSYSTNTRFSPTTFYLNSSERRPSNISKSAIENIAAASLNTWKNGSNNCGISRTLDVPGSISYGSWTYDGNFTSAGGCGARDGVNVIDWGPLAGSTLGLTCTWSFNGAPIEKDIRLDTSSRSWVTTATGCSGAYDVRAVLTHEMGHGLALGHAAERGGSDLTMSPNIAACNTSARALGAGDVAAIDAQHGG